MLILFFFAPSLAFSQETNCGDGIDNDGDGLIDCFDDDCAGIASCEDFFFGQPEPDCNYQPPELEEIRLNLLFKTDEVRYPIEQRCGVMVGDMNGDGVPDLVARDNNPARIHIFSGDDGRILQSIVTPSTHPFGQVAIADVDADGLGDVFHIESTGGLARYEFGNPNAVWRTANNVGDDNVVSTPQLADINQDGVAEVFVGKRIFNALTGLRYANGSNTVNVGGYATGGNADRYPVFFDLFKQGDPKPGGGTFGAEANGMEYIAGNQVWTVAFNTTGTADNGTFLLAAQLSATNNERDGFTSIADINGDGRMDVAVMAAGRVYAWDPYTNQQIGSTYSVPGTSAGGRINIGDFDGDGDVELGFAGNDIYIVRNYVDNNGDANLNNGTWSTLWQKDNLDDGSERTGSTLFDFDGNGTVEVVYSEEENLFIYDGPTGNELFRIQSRAGTRTEYPLVADVNGDGTAEIIVTAQAQNGPSFSGSDWISVYESANQPWVPARKVWNQHGYHVTNVNNDLTIPRFQQNNLNPALGQRYNNFLVQTAVGGGSEANIRYPAPDAIIMVQIGSDGLPVIDFTGCPNEIIATLVIDNEGAAPLPASTPISYYIGDPRVTMATLIQTTRINTQVEAGGQVIVQVAIPVGVVPAGSRIYLSVNDPGFAMADLPFEESDFPLTGTPECIYSNNVNFLGNVRCGEVCNDGIDNDGDGLIDEPNLTQFENTGCPGDVLQAITNDSPGGTYSVLGGSVIGTTVDQNGVVTLGNNFTGTPVTETIRYDDGICVEDVMVTTVDNEAPKIACPGNAAVNVDANCTTPLSSYIMATQSSDNCSATGNIVITQAPAIGSNLTLGANTVTMTATDQSGNAATCTFTVTAVDRIAPVPVCPAATTAMLTANCSYTIPDLTNISSSDNCSAEAALILAQTPVQGTVFNGNGTNVMVTITAKDESGNSGNCTYVITLADNTPPAITCPGNQTRDVSANDCTLSVPDFRGQAGRQDNCSGFNQITVTQNPAPGTSVGPGVTTITLTATDAAGNMADCSFTLTGIDRTPPMITCPGNITVDADPVMCAGTVTDVTGLAMATDNCGSGGLTITQTPAAGTTFTSSTQNVVVTATDAAGNTRQCNVTFIKRDVTPPTLTCVGPQTLVVDANNCLAILPNYMNNVASDACGGVSVVQEPGPGTNLSNNVVVTITATDNVGQQTTCTIDVTVVDQTPPSILCPSPQTIAVDGTCEVPLPDYTGQASTSDNCDPRKGPVSVSQSPAANTMYDINDSPVTVTLTATDASGNMGTCTFQVELMDNQPPQISCPVSPQIDQLDGDCDAMVPDFRNQTMVSSTCTMDGFTLVQVPAPGTVVSVESTTSITITATDINGNSVSCSFDYVTEDVTSPTITCPAPQTASLDSGCDFAIPDYSGMATVADNCSSLAPAAPPILTLTQSPVAGTVVSEDGTVTQIMLTATDAAGNSTSCTFRLTTEDNTPPALTCPTDQTENVDDGCAFVLPDYTPQVTAVENCTIPGPVSYTQSPPAGTQITGDGTTTLITITATDAAGNVASCDFTLTLEDNTDPEITCPQAITIAVDADCRASVPNLISGATVTDNCQGSNPLLVSQDIPAGTMLMGDGTTQIVTLTADDGNGNTANCTVVLTLDDTTPPTVSCPAAQDLNLDMTGCSATLPDFSTQLTLADNCTAPGTLAVQQMPVPGAVVSGANTVETVTFNVDDGNGNSTSCSFDITLRDVTSPTIVCPAPATLALGSDCSVALPDYTSQTVATDDCAMTAAITLTQSPAAGTELSFDGEQVMVTITAADGNGNTTSCTFPVTAEDQTLPMVICPADRNEPVSGNCDFTLPDYTGEAGVMDNCSEAAAITITQSPAVGTVIPEAQLNQPQTITLTATDAAGNSQSCTFAITPVDETNPTIVCPEAQSILLDAVGCEAVLGDYTGLGATMDNCTDAPAIGVTQNIAAGTVYSGLTLPIIDVVLTATDASGNTADCSFKVYILDEIDPTVDCAAANQTVALDENCNGEIPDLIPDLVTNDNCSANALTILQSPAAGAAYGGNGTTVDVTFTVMDASGNTVSCVATITFEDQSPPNPVICPGDQDLNVDDVCAVSLPNYTGGATVIDNCRAQGNIIITQSPLPGTMVAGDGTVIPVTLTADDGNGNTATCTFDVTLRDENALDVTCPGGQIVIASSDDCDGEYGDYTGLVTAVNQCMSPAAGVTYVQSPAAGTPLFPADLDVSQTVTITAIDLNGNPSSCTFQVTLVDTLAPVIVCPANDAQIVDASCSHLVLDYRSDATITDNCAALGELIVTQEPMPGAPITGPDAIRTVTISAVDPSGNQSQCAFQLEVSDGIAPVLACPEPDTLLTNGACQVTIGDYTSEALADDDCTLREDIVFSQVPPSGTVISGHLTTQTITITATDASGNSSSCDFTVTAKDAIAPTVLCTGDKVVRPDANCEALMPDYRGDVRTFDNCAANSAITLTQRPAPGSPLSGQGNAKTVTIIADDGNGNRDSCTFVVRLEDDLPPEITCPAAKLVDADADCTYDLEDLTIQAIVTDNCTNPAMIIVTQNIGIGQTYSGDGTEVLVTLTADDRNGNTAQCTTTITLEDNTDPTITCPADQTILVDTGCGALVPDYRSADVIDNCTAPTDITVTQTLAPGASLTGHNEVSVVTLTADDGHGNTASCSFNLTLLDETPPAITCPPAQEIFVDGSCETVLPDYVGLTTASDNCSPAPAIAQNNPAGTPLTGLGTQTVTMTADDGNGNTTTCDFTVTVSDNTPPELTCPPLSIIAGNATCTINLADYRDSIMVADNCGPTSVQNGALTLVQSPLEGAMISGLGTTQTVTITATDPSGNTTDCLITVEVADTTRPTIVCPNDTTLAVDIACATIVPDYTGLPIVMDNCNDATGISVTQTPVAGTMVSDEANLITVTLTATDESGNTISCDFNVQLIDSIPPMVVCPADDVISVDGTCEVLLPDYRPNAGPTDNCSDPAAITLTQRPAPGEPLSGDGTTREVTIIVTDESGNQDSCKLTVTLEDSTEPMIICPADQELTADDDCEIVIPDYTSEAIASSTCDQSAITITQLPAIGTTISGHNTTQTVTLTAEDASGNMVSCSFEVTLLDREAPEITVCQNDTIGVLSAACTYTLPDYWVIGPATAQDNCRPTGTTSTSATGDQIIYTQVPIPGTVLMDAFTTTTITLTADDGNGNTISCDFELTLTDTTSPTITCPADTVANPDAGCDFALEDYTGRAIIADNCTNPADLVVTQSPAAGTVISGQSTSQDIILTVEDPSGNIASCTFNLMLQDTTSPTIVCPDAQVETLTATCEFIVPDYTGEAVTDDNCTDVTNIIVTQDPEAGTVIAVEGEGDIFTITLTADDGNGNTADCAFNITLDDVTPPVITCPADPTIFVDAGCNALLPDLVAVTTATDNCENATAGSGITITQSPLAMAMFSNDDTEVVVTLTADDGNGNTSQCQVTVTLQDTISPMIMCPDNEVLLTNENCEVMVPDYRAQAIKSDNCTTSGEILVTQDIAPGTVLSEDGTTQVVTLTADDGNGNTANCTLQLTVDDNRPPTIACPMPQTQFTDANCMVVIADYSGLGMTDDNCTDMATTTVTQTPAPGTVFTGVQDVVVTLLADDGNRNTATCDFVLSIRDNTAPDLACPATQQETANANCVATLGDYTGLATVTDNCSTLGDANGNGITVTQSPPAGTTIMGFDQAITVTLTATDSSGNVATCTFQVELIDGTDPTIVCPAAQEINAGTDCGFTIPDYRSLGIVDDNCGPGMLTVAQSPDINSVLTNLGTTQEVTLTVTEASGNSANCSFTVTTTSATPPPAQATVTLAVVNRPTGSGTVNLLDAFDDAAESNLSNTDLDQMMDQAVGPYNVTFYLNMADADGEQNDVSPFTYDPAVNGEVVLVRIEDPTTGCFTLSQILIEVREPGISNAMDSTFCSKPGVTLKVDGRPQAGGQGSTIVRHQWTIISIGTTRLPADRVMSSDQQTVMINTAGLRSGSIVLEYQFFEDYGDGALVGSVPRRVVMEVLQVGSGDFFWDGRN
ncbi:HYR domain-containing protein [Neolewinella persica]|uniref:HYR domain-containing protein n=1 Tax=Neolewinella persica TaxID=70998 RepID=UPI00036B6F9A|nr:HYR domain-containing protein [Neolewinella persica]